MSSKREERIQNLAAGLLIAGRTPAEALAQSAIFVELCEARDAAEDDAEATQKPDDDPELAIYVNAVKEMDSCVEMWFVVNDYKHGFTPVKTVERWCEYGEYLRSSE